MIAHSETRSLPYSAQQMFELVGNVEEYPRFLPWCAAARINMRTTALDHEELRADLVIAFKLFRERYGSLVRLYPAQETIPARISVQGTDGMFRTLNTNYVFHPQDAQQCTMEFSIAFEFRNRLLQKAGGILFEQAMRRIVGAFEERAATLYTPKIS